MNKRVIAAVVAGVLALLGVVVLYAWAQGANDRAFEGAKLVTVVRATESVPQGTKAADLSARTELAELPQEAVPEGAVTDLAAVAGKTTNAPMAKGEVLVETRMSTPGDKGKGQTAVPKGFQEVTISLEAQRSVAGQVKPGDTVGVVLSYQSANETSRMVLNGVLVTQSSNALNAEAGTGAMVTLAVRGPDAIKIINAMEFGKVWLTLQNADTDTGGDAEVTPEAAVR